MVDEKINYHKKDGVFRAVTIVLPEEWFEIKDGLEGTWKEIVGLGLKAKKENPQLIKRIRKIEEDVDFLKKVYKTK